jgi:hypothetical protein
MKNPIFKEDIEAAVGILAHHTGLAEKIEQIKISQGILRRHVKIILSDGWVSPEVTETFQNKIWEPFGVSILFKEQNLWSKAHSIKKRIETVTSEVV